MASKKLAALGLVAVTLGSAAVCQAATELPKGIQAQLPQGYEVMQYAAGPALGNNRSSFLVVVHHAVDTRENASPRPLLISKVRTTEPSNSRLATTSRFYAPMKVGSATRSTKKTMAWR